MNAEQTWLSGPAHQVLEHLWAAAIVTDPEGTIRSWNSQAERLYGWRASEVLGRSVLELNVHPEDADLAAEIMNRLADGERWEGAFRVRRKDGVAVVVQVRDAPLLGPDGAVVGILGLSVELGTDAIGNAARAAVTATQLEVALDAAEMGVWDWDVASGALTWSPAMEAMFGLERGTFAGTFDAYVDLLHPDDRQEVVETIQAATGGDEPMRVEHRVTWPDGSVRWIEGRGRAVRGVDGALIGMTGISADVTARRQAIDELSKVLAAEQAARQASEHAPQWLAQLGPIDASSGPVTRTLDELLAELLQRIRDLMEADTVAILLSDEGSTELAVRASLGLEERPSDVHIPYGAGVAGRVAASREPAIIPDLSAVEVANDRLRSGGLRSLVAVPLCATGGRCLGVLHTGSRMIDRFDEEDAKLLSFVGDRIAGAIERVRLLEAEQAARAAAETASERLAFLSTATATLSASLDREEVLGRLVDLVVPRMADWCVVVVPAGSALRIGAFRHVDPEAQSRLAGGLSRFTIPVDSDAASARAFRTGEAQHIPAVTPEVIRAVSGDPEFADFVSVIGVSSAISIPLVARGQSVGVLTFAWRDGSAPASWADQTVMRELAARAAVAVENAELYTREHHVAEALQRAILPQSLPPAEGLELAARYLPATVGADVGGDWYDSFVLPSGDVALVVGDVAGHGIMPAAIMGQLRNAVRFYAREGYSPAALLASLDGLASELGDEGFGTAVYAVWRPSTGRLTWASAGHLPPLLVTKDGPSFLQDGAGIALGAGGGRGDYGESAIELPAGSLLVLYTDGLIERRDRGLEEGFRQLARAADELGGATVDDVCDSLIATVAPERRDDDLCLLVVRRL